MKANADTSFLKTEHGHDADRSYILGLVGRELSCLHSHKSQRVPEAVMVMQGRPPCRSHAHFNSVLKTKVNFVHLPFQGGFFTFGFSLVR